MKKRTYITSLALCSMLLFSPVISTSAWAVPGQISYQGELTDDVGVALDGSYQMRFYLYDSEIGGGQLWNSPAGEEQIVSVNGGIYNIQLGAVHPLNSDIFDTDDIWIEIAIYNAGNSTWETLSPRQKLSSTAFAFKAADADSLEGMTSVDFAEASHEHDAEYVNEGQPGSVSAAMLQDGATLSEIIDDDGTGSGLNADYLDGLSENSFFQLGQNETVTGLPSFYGGTSGKTPPFYVDSTDTIKFLSADMVDGLHSSSFAPSSHTHDSRYYTETESNSLFAAISHLHDSRYYTETESEGRYVNVTGDTMTGSLDATYSSALDYVFKGNGELGPTLGYLGVQGQTDFDGILTADWSGREIGVVGISTGSSTTDNYGVMGHSTYVGVRGEYSASPSTDYGELGRSSRGAVGKSSYTTGIGVEGVASNTGDYINYGGHFTASGDDGRGVYGYASGASGRGVYGYATGLYARGGYFETNGQYSQGVYARNTYNSADVYASLATAGTGVIGYHSSSSYGWVGTSSYALWGQNGATNGYGAYATSYGSGGIGVYARASASNGTGIYAYGGTSGYAGHFRGKIKITDHSTNATVMELGAGLDYAEGFDVSEKYEIAPGTVLIIDPKNPGKLKLSDTAYDTKVAGIVAGANGIGSGVRLGADQFDNDVALAGRVFCNVDATQAAIKTGDLLTTSDMPGYAMKAGDYDKSKGAILGKAMQDMAEGEKGQILVLVTLQ